LPGCTGKPTGGKGLQTIPGKTRTMTGMRSLKILMPVDKIFVVNSVDNKYFVKLNKEVQSMDSLFISKGRASDGKDKYFERLNVERKIWLKIK
jgi:hypothetical protein